MNTIEVFVSCGVWLPNKMMCDQGRLPRGAMGLSVVCDCGIS